MARGRIGGAGARVVGFFDGINKIVGAVAAGLALLTALGLITLAGSGDGGKPSGPGEVEVDRSEMRASASVPSLARQDDARDANDYAPDNMLDGDVRTAWVEGVRGLGSGTRLSFQLPERVQLSRIRIVSGYAKSTAVLLDNGAPRTVLVRTDGLRRPLRRTLARDGRPQTIRGPFGTTRRVDIEIVSAYPGDRFDDVALSEVSFFAQRS